MPPRPGRLEERPTKRAAAAGQGGTDNAASEVASLLADLVVAPTHEAQEAIQARLTAIRGNGHGSPAKASKPSTPPEDAITPEDAVERIRRGADWPSVVKALYQRIQCGEVEESVARDVLLAAYPEKDWDGAYAAAKADAGRQPIPILSPKDPKKSVLAFLRAFHETPDGLSLVRHYQDGFIRWDGGSYRPLEEKMIRRDLWDFLPMGGMKPNMGRVNQVVTGLEAITALAEDTEPLSWLGAAPEGYPKDTKQIIPMNNGLFYTVTEEMHDPTPQFFNLSALPYSYEPKGEPPVEWLHFLDTIWGKDAENNGYPNDPQSIETLQEIFGYLLTGDNSFHKMFFIQGPTRSGKGTIGNVIEALLGEENVVSPSLETLSGDHGLDIMRGKTAAVIRDVMVSERTDVRLAVERLKNISGGDPVTINPKFKHQVSCRLPTRIVLCGNEMARFSDASGALASRFIVLKQTRSFLGEEDMTLSDRLRLEIPRIFHWALEGRHRLYERGYFVIPESAREMMADLVETSSPITAFVRASCRVGDGFEVGQDALFKAWGEWRTKRGSRDGGNLSWFSRDLAAAFPKITKRRRGAYPNQTIVYLGLTLGDPDLPLLP